MAERAEVDFGAETNSEGPMATADERKQIIKEALKEWLDEKWVIFGKWSAGMIGAALLVGIVYFMLWINGWHR